MTFAKAAITHSNHLVLINPQETGFDLVQFLMITAEERRSMFSYMKKLRMCLFPPS